MHRLVAVTALLVLVAGCADPAADDAPANGPFAAHDEERLVPQTANYTGLVVRGKVTGEGARLDLAATASNDGPRTYRVETGCGEPWREELLRDGERLQMREPVVRCLAFALRDFRPGDFIPFKRTWNGTLWEDGRGYVPAAPGDYVWAAQFVAYKSSDGDLKRFDLDFSVTVR